MVIFRENCEDIYAVRPLAHTCVPCVIFIAATIVPLLHLICRSQRLLVWFGVSLIFSDLLIGIAASLLISPLLFRSSQGIEFQAGSEDNAKFAKLMQENFPDRFKKARRDGLPQMGCREGCRVRENTAAMKRWRARLLGGKDACGRFPGASHGFAPTTILPSLLPAK